MKIRMRFHFTGEVQGVGFRYRACHAAGGLELTGWVRNEYDGSVTLEAQGERPAVAELLRRVEDSFLIRVDHLESRQIPLRPDEEGFTIRG